MISLNEQNHLDIDKWEESDIWGIIQAIKLGRGHLKKKKTINLYYMTATWSL